MTVFVVNQPRENPKSGLGASYDISPALQYGPITFIFSQVDFPSPSEDLDAAIAHAWDVLENFDPEADFVVWAGGDPISMLLVAPILFDLAQDNVRYLKFERARNVDGAKTQAGYYEPKLVNLFKGR